MSDLMRWMWEGVCSLSCAATTCNYQLLTCSFFLLCMCKSTLTTPKGTCISNEESNVQACGQNGVDLLVSEESFDYASSQRIDCQLWNEHKILTTVVG